MSHLARKFCGQTEFFSDTPNILFQHAIDPSQKSPTRLTAEIGIVGSSVHEKLLILHGFLEAGIYTQ